MEDEPRNYIFEFRKDAEKVLSTMQELIRGRVVTVSDFKVLVNVPIHYGDSLYGWVILKGVEVKNSEDVENAYYIDLPFPGVITNINRGEQSMLKKLVAKHQMIYWIDREKVSVITESDEHNKTDFLIDGVWVTIDMYIENAHIWMTSFDPVPERESRPE